MEKNEILLDILNDYRNLAFCKSRGISMQCGTPLAVDDIVLIHVKRVTFEDEAPRKEAIENVLSSLRLSGVNFLYIIRGRKDHVEFYYGIVRNTIVNMSRLKRKDEQFHEITESILKKSIEGNFRGSEVEIIDDTKTHIILEELKSKRYVSCIDGVPGINKDESVNFQGVDRLVDTMLGEDFLFVVSAFCLNQNIIDNLKTNVCDFYDQLTPWSKRTEQKGSTEGISSSIGKTIGKNESKSSNDSTSTSQSTSKNTSVGKTEIKANGKNQESGTEGKTTTEQRTSSHTDQTNLTESSSNSETKGKSESKSTSFSFEHSAKNVQDWMAYADDFLLKRLDYGQGKGLFMTNIALFADNELTRTKLENTTTALFSGEAGNKTPLTVNRELDKSYQANVRNLQIPKVRFAFEMSDKEVAVRTALSQYVASKHNEKCSYGYWGTWMSVNELGIIAGLPRKEVVGLSLSEEVDFGLNYDSGKIDAKNRLNLGHLVQSGIVKDVPIYLDKNVLNKHVFVCGVTGSGKTTTCMTLLRQSKLPFLVIEPAKTEYRILTNEDPTVLVFTLGKEDAPFRLNPLEFLPSETISSHIDMLKASIEASFDMEAAIPQIIEAALYKCYEEKGWDVITGKNKYYSDPFADGVYSFPILSELIECTKKVVNEQGFDERLKNDYIGSIKARLQGLIVGAKGVMLNTPRSIDFESLIHKKVILELENIKSGTEKSLVMGFILANLNEAIKSAFLKNKQFKHITLIEEAHRLLSKYMPGDSSCKKNGVETFADMLAEVRKYGECLIIADQIPSKMAPDVLKNTNTKLVHKIFAQDDKEAIGNTLSLTDEQKGYLSNLNTGRVVAFTQGWAKSIQVQVNKGNDTTNEFAQDQKIHEISLNYYIRNYKRGVFPEIQCLSQMPSVHKFEQILSDNSIYGDLKRKFRALCDKKKEKFVNDFKDTWNRLSVKYNVDEMAMYLLKNSFSFSSQNTLQLLTDLLEEIEKGTTDFSAPEKLNYYEEIFY